MELPVRDPEEFALPINGRKSRLQRRDFVALGNHLKIPEVVIRRPLDGVPGRLLQALRERPSPWVSPAQAKAKAALVTKNAARLASPVRELRRPGLPTIPALHG